MATIANSFLLLIVMLLFLAKVMKREISLMWILFCFASLLLAGVSLLREGTAANFNAFINFFLCISIYYFYADGDLLDTLQKQFIKMSRLFILANVFYVAVLAMSVIFGDGLSTNWNTISLKGPYELNHTLSYILILYACIQLYIWKQTSLMSCFILAIFDGVLILATAVRTTFLAAAVLVIFFLLNEKQKSLIYVLLGILLTISVAMSTDIFTNIWAKTIDAIAQSGDISNGREYIFRTAWQAFATNANDSKYLFGIGISGIQSYFYNDYGSSIQAHNDFLNAIVCYGPLMLGFYIWGFVRFCKKTRELWLFLFLISLAFFNGFFLYGQAVVVVAYALVFFRCTYPSKKYEF